MLTERTRRPLATLGAAALLVLSIAACAPQPAEPAATEPISADDALLKYADCMRDHGVQMDDPEPGGGISIDAEGLSPEEVQAAEEDCADLREQALGEPEGGGISEEQKQRILDQVACMRERGYDVPDPTFDGGMATNGDNSGSNTGPAPDDPNFQRDAAECAEEAGLEPPSTSGDER